MDKTDHITKMHNISLMQGGDEISNLWEANVFAVLDGHELIVEHTPNAWHIGDTNPNFGPKVYGADGMMVADTGRIYSRTDEEEAANANLIATAPKLLESLTKAYALILALSEQVDDGDLEHEAIDPSEIKSGIIETLKAAQPG